jgi:hypothetical protein
MPLKGRSPLPLMGSTLLPLKGRGLRGVLPVSGRHLLPLRGNLTVTVTGTVITKTYVVLTHHGVMMTVTMQLQ